MSESKVLFIDRQEESLDVAFDIVFEMFNLGHDDVPIPYIVGKPGGGKTKMLKQKAIDNKFGFKAVTPALERLEKFGGIPETEWLTTNDSYLTKEMIAVKNHSYINNFTNNEIIESVSKLNKKNYILTTVWSMPQLIAEINEEAHKYPLYILLMDDWHLCPDVIQQIGYEFFTYRSLNGHKIPDNVRIVLAGNESSAAGAKIQMSAIRNRCFVMYTKSHPDYWITNYAEPENLFPIGISFFLNKDNWVYFHEEESTKEQFGSPRSWTYLFKMAERLLNSDLYKKSSNKSSLLLTLCQSCVSKSAASAFFNYYKIFKDVNLDELYVHNKVNIPSDRINQYAYVTAMTSECYNRCSTYEGVDNVKYMESIHSYIKMLNVFGGNDPNASFELAVCSFRQLAGKRENKTLKLLSGKKLIANIIENKNISYEVLNRFKEQSKEFGNR